MSSGKLGTLPIAGHWPGLDTLEDGQISGHWPGLWTSGIEAAVSWPNGKVYFFKGTEYRRFSLATFQLEYNRAIVGPWRGLELFAKGRLLHSIRRRDGYRR